MITALPGWNRGEATQTKGETKPATAASCKSERKTYAMRRTRNTGACTVDGRPYTSAVEPRAPGWPPI